MNLRRKRIPAHREYYLTLVRSSGERVPWYLPQVFGSLTAAQRVADERNAHYRHGQLIVEYVDRPASVALVGTLRL